MRHPKPQCLFRYFSLIALTITSTLTSVHADTNANDWRSRHSKYSIAYYKLNTSPNAVTNAAIIRSATFLHRIGFDSERINRFLDEQAYQFSQREKNLTALLPEGLSRAHGFANQMTANTLALFDTLAPGSKAVGSALKDGLSHMQGFNARDRARDYLASIHELSRYEVVHLLDRFSADPNFHEVVSKHIDSNRVLSSHLLGRSLEDVSQDPAMVDYETWLQNLPDPGFSGAEELSEFFQRHETEFRNPEGESQTASQPSNSAASEEFINILKERLEQELQDSNTSSGDPTSVPSVTQDTREQLHALKDLATAMSSWAFAGEQLAILSKDDSLLKFSRKVGHASAGLQMITSGILQLMNNSAQTGQLAAVSAGGNVFAGALLLLNTFSADANAESDAFMKELVHHIDARFDRLEGAVNQVAVAAAQHHETQMNAIASVLRSQRQFFLELQRANAEILDISKHETETRNAILAGLNVTNTLINDASERSRSAVRNLVNTRQFLQREVKQKDVEQAILETLAYAKEFSRQTMAWEPLRKMANDRFVPSDPLLSAALLYSLETTPGNNSCSSPFELIRSVNDIFLITTSFPEHSELVTRKVREAVRASILELDEQLGEIASDAYIKHFAEEEKMAAEQSALALKSFVLTLFQQRTGIAGSWSHEATPEAPASTLSKFPSDPDGLSQQWDPAFLRKALPAELWTAIHMTGTANTKTPTVEVNVTRSWAGMRREEQPFSRQGNAHRYRLHARPVVRCRISVDEKHIATLTCEDQHEVHAFDVVQSLNPGVSEVPLLELDAKSNQMKPAAGVPANYKPVTHLDKHIAARWATFGLGGDGRNQFERWEIQRGSEWDACIAQLQAQIEGVRQQVTAEVTHDLLWTVLDALELDQIDGTPRIASPGVRQQLKSAIELEQELAYRRRLLSVALSDTHGNAATTIADGPLGCIDVSQVALAILTCPFYADDTKLWNLMVLSNMHPREVVWEDDGPDEISGSDVVANSLWKSSGWEPILFAWSFSGINELSQWKGLQIAEPSDPHTWNDNFLLVSGGKLDWQWSYDGPIEGYVNIRWHEPADAEGTWTDNFLGYKGKTRHEFLFSCAGRPSDWFSIPVIEPSEPPETTWWDNFFCWRPVAGKVHLRGIDRYLGFRKELTMLDDALWRNVK